jgi:hypothetical protein
MYKSIFVSFLRTLLVMILLSPAIAQMKLICEFKDVNIPYNLKNEDSLFEKGKYDFELLKVTNVFYLRIKKKGKPVCLIPHGQKFMYENMYDPDIPQNAKFQIKRNPALKIAYLIFETGSHHPDYPSIKVRFKLKYED